MKCNGEEGALSPITTKLLGTKRGVRGLTYWQYNDRDMEDIYYEKYP